MRSLRIYVEDIAGDWFAWIEGCPGAYARAGSPEQAIQQAPLALGNYVAWLRSHNHEAGALSDATRTSLYIDVAERYKAERSNDGREVNAFFACHAAPLTNKDLDEYLCLLSYARSDLLNALREIPPDEYHRAPFGGRSISAILVHIAEAERRALASVGLNADAVDGRDALLAIGMARRDTERHLRTMDDRSRDRVIADAYGERWTARKALDRVLWHERYHAAEVAERTNPGAFLRSILVRQEAAGDRSFAGVW
jgi:uncharacterized damage-inducible protein DinB